MPKITTIEVKADKNGNPMKVTTFDTGVKVFVNSKYDEPVYEQVVEGAEFELTKDGDFNKIKYDKPTKSNGSFPSKVEKMMDKKAENIKEAQERKNESIAFFNATNNAINLLAASTSKPNTQAGVQEFVTSWRGWFLEEWKKYESGDYQGKHNPGF